jgi:hypothetical protein
MPHPVAALCLTVPLLVGLAPTQGLTMSASPQMRYVDFHAQLDRPGVVVAVGRLGRCREGRRERLEDGKLGGGTTVTSVSGTQYFVVPVTTTLQPQVVFGKDDGDSKRRERLRLQFDIQLARLPDGSEQRQVRTGNGARLEEGTLALFVVAPAAKDKKQKGLDLLHVIPFDAKLDPGPDGEAKFVDAMRDFYIVNRRVADLEQALAAFDAADEGEAGASARQAALARLKELVDHPPELRISQNDPLLVQHAGPLQARAQKRLAEAAGEHAEKHEGDDDKD